MSKWGPADEDTFAALPTECVLCGKSSDTPEAHHQHMEEIHDA